MKRSRRVWDWLAWAALVAVVVFLLGPIVRRALQFPSPAPVIGTTLSEILIDGKFVPDRGIKFSINGVSYYAVYGRVGKRGFPSGPPLVILDSALVVVDSTKDSGDISLASPKWLSGLPPATEWADWADWAELETTLPTP